MEILFYDYNINELARSDKIISSVWELKFNDIGTGQIVLNINDPVYETLLENKYLLVCQTDCEHEITGVVVGSTYGEELTVYCRTLNWFLSKMVTPDTFGTLHKSVAEAAEDILGVSYGCDIHMGDKPVFENTPYFWRNTYNSAIDVIKDCLANDNAGHRVRLGTADGKFYLDVLKGSRLDLFIGTNDGSASSVSRQKDIIDLANAGFYEKSVKTADADGNETEEMQWTEYPPPEGTAKMLQWYSVLSGSSQSEAKSSLKGCAEVDKTTAAAQKILFKTDYNLGDFVRVQIENDSFVYTQEQQITGVTLNWDAESGYSEKPTLEAPAEYIEGEPPEEENLT